MRAAAVCMMCIGAAGCCSGPSAAAVQTATTSIQTQAEVAKAAVATCGVEGEQRQAACDLVARSLEGVIATNAELKAQAEKR